MAQIDLRYWCRSLVQFPDQPAGSSSQRHYSSTSRYSISLSHNQPLQCFGFFFSDKRTCLRDLFTTQCLIDSVCNSTVFMSGTYMMFRFVFLRIQPVRTCQICLIATPYTHTEYPILGTPTPKLKKKGTPTPSSCKDAVTGSTVALGVAWFDSFLAPLVPALCYVISLKN